MDRRLIVLITLIVIIVGVTSRVFTIGNVLWDKYLGDALYAVLFFLLLSFVWTSGSTLIKFIIVFIFIFLIELFQLTGIPQELAGSSNMAIKLVGILLGMEFSWWDIVAYGVGLCVIGGVDYYMLRRMNES